LGRVLVAEIGVAGVWCGCFGSARAIISEWPGVVKDSVDVGVRCARGGYDV
jgi:hypothetical protein